MKSTVCFIPSSFDFSVEDKELILALDAASYLVKKMDSEFTNFIKSGDFYDYAHEKIYTSEKSQDMIGYLTTAIYDGAMNKAILVDEPSQKLIEKTNMQSPEYNRTWLSIYCYSADLILTDKPERTIYNEYDLVSYSSEILVKNSLTHTNYAKNFK
ncbi:hypothetical protein KKJ04_16470 [Xenorhabdus bovienii]|uniref:hypothetical protein n=1 Tax=Xenorhabdus bovienii TaxID=40576 RepID=UPI0023B254AD|nr:hypothetical protein [Xenorhabdus bovienii]MDE9447145.1 hypothetical protein [Xenorhabdus bovienii]